MSDCLETTDRLPQGRALAARQAGGDVLLRDPVSGTVHFLSPTAALVWECCDGQTTVETCAARMRASFKIKPDADLVADIRETVEGFQRLGLLLEAPRDAG